MIYSNELRNLHLYRKRFQFPVNKRDRHHGNAVTLLTPNINSSIQIINGNNQFVNPKFYESYYVEKDISYLITSKDVVTETSAPIPEDEQYNWLLEGCEGSINEVFFSPADDNYKKIVFNGYNADIRYARNIIQIDTLEEINSKYFKEKIQYPLSVTIYPTGKIPKCNSQSINVPCVASCTSVEDFNKKCIVAMCKLLIYTVNEDAPKLIVDKYAKVLYKMYMGSSIKHKVDDPVAYAIYDYITTQSDGISKMLYMIRRNDYTYLGVSNIKNMIDEYKPLFESKMKDSTRIKKNTTTQLRAGSNHILDKVVTPNSTIQEPGVQNAKSEIPTPQIPTAEIPSQQIPVTNADGGSIEDQAANAVEKMKKDKRNDEKITNESYNATELGINLRETMVDGRDYIVFENGFVTFLNEKTSETTANSRLYKILYKDRLRASKQVFQTYDRITEACPNIKYTYLNYSRYKRRNMFIDLSYYNEVYFKNSTYDKLMGIELYMYLIKRLIYMAKDNEYDNNTVVIPVLDWDLNPTTKMWYYNQSINPISLIYNLMKTNMQLLVDTFGSMDIIFLGQNSYFKMNADKLTSKDLQTFLRLINKIRANGRISSTDCEDDENDIKKDSKAVITDTILDKIETTKNVEIHRLVGDSKLTKNKEPKTTKNPDITTNAKINKDEVKADLEKDTEEKTKEKIAEKIEKVADTSASTQDAMETLENDEEFQKLLRALDNNAPRGPEISLARSKRIKETQHDFMEKEVNGKSVESLIRCSEEYVNEEIPELDLPIDSINEEWHHLKSASLPRYYNPDADIVAALNSLYNMTYPIAIRNITVTNNTTSEDAINTYEVDCESGVDGKRFKLVFDVPILVDGYYMTLHGNNKTIEAQSTLFPILKTESDTAQMISNYKKIFFRIYGTAAGKSNVYADRLLKTLLKKEYSDIQVVYSDNTKINVIYDLPIDYIDLSQVISKITVANTLTVYFNQYEIHEKFNIDAGKGVPFATIKTKDGYEVIYHNNPNEFLSHSIITLILEYTKDESFAETFNASTRATKYMYSNTSIMSTEIPIAVIVCYHVGITSMMDIAKIEYEITQKVPSRKVMLTAGQDCIRFSDGAIVFKETPAASLLMNGLKVCNTEDYSLEQMNSRNTYLEFLDGFGGRIKSDGLDNFYDCMIDPITKSILKHAGLPTDYVELLIYANNLLIDNKYYDHGDMSVRRIKRSELIPSYVISELYMAYGRYATQMKHGRNMPMTIKRSAVVDAILTDCTGSDLPCINMLSENTAYNTVSSRGHVGMNSDMSYSLDKRTFHKSKINIESLSTGFAGTVGIPRVQTINCNINTVRGFSGKPDDMEMSPVSTFCMTESISSFMSDHDDPFRTAMTFGQSTNHMVRCDNYMPCLISTGADQALPYLTANIFSYKAKEKGKVKMIVENKYMVLEYADGKKDYVDISPSSRKNSATGTYISLQLTPRYTVGQSFKNGDIVAYDPKSLGRSAGISENLSYLFGTLVKSALLISDEGFEDSAYVTKPLSKALATDVIKEREVSITDINTNVFNMVKVGQEIQEGESLIIIQQPFEEEDANALVKALSSNGNDGEEIVNELGKIKIKSSVTGWVHEISILRTCELEDMSDSLRKIVKSYENEIEKTKKVLEAEGIDTRGRLKPNYKLSPTGRMKNIPNGVKIIFKLRYHDNFGVGDKLIYNNANKGVDKGLITEGLEPYSLDRPGEIVHEFINVTSLNSRLITSNQKAGVLLRTLIEADRHMKDMFGFEYPLNLF